MGHAMGQMMGASVGAMGAGMQAMVRLFIGSFFVFHVVSLFISGESVCEFCVMISLCMLNHRYVSPS